MNKNFNGYDYLTDLVIEMKSEKHIVLDDLIVYFEMKHNFQKEYEKHCEILKMIIKSGIPYSYFENDWWEGQEDIKLIGITPMSYLPETEPYYKVKEE